MMLHLSPGERSVLEQIQLKAGKPGFWCKIRVVYIAPKEIFSKPAAIGGIMGAFRQFNTQDVNGFTIDPFTKIIANYFYVPQRIARRQRLLWKAYRIRSGGRGRLPMFLNIEELATIWHFPLIDTKAPLISKALSKRAEPPLRLPMRDDESVTYQKPVAPEKKFDDVPDNLPFM